MPKKRTKSQKVGEIGENIFKDFALENDLLPNKMEYDYGIDFVCQTTSKLNSRIDSVGGVPRKQQKLKDKKNINGYL